MKIALNVNYNNTDYTSEFAEVNEEQLNICQGHLIQCAKGELIYFEFKGENQTYYFPEEVLKHSVLSIIYKE